MELTPEEVAYLRKHGYAPSDVFDGSSSCFVSTREGLRDTRP